MLTKTIDVEIKAIGDEGEGRFQAYASTFGVVDSYGDMVIQGAFAETLGDFGPGGADIPLYWRHRMDDPFMLIGKTLAAKEDEHGLWVDCGFLATNAAKQVYALLSAGLVRQMSFAYDVVEGAWVDRPVADGGGYYELRKLRLHEVSVVPIGANQETEILAVKAARDAAIAATKTVRDNADPQPGTPAADDQEPADAATDAKTEEPDTAKVEEPMSAKSARALGLIHITDAQ